MSRLRSGHDPFHVDGGCTCPGTRTLFQLRIEGHTADCTAGRRAAVEQRRQLGAALAQTPAAAKAERRLRDAG